MRFIQSLTTTLVCLAAILAMPHCGAAAQKAFFVFQSPGAETVPGGAATNFVVTLTYSNASGTINGAVFTNGVAVSPAGQGVTASLSSIYAGPVNSGGGTTNLTLTISAAASATANTTYQIIVAATNNSFTANVPSGIFMLTNNFIVGPPANSNAFTIALSPAAASCRISIATNFASSVTLVDCSSTISGTISNGVTVTGPDLVNVTASLDNPYAALTSNFGQTNLSLNIHVNPNATPGAYAVTVMGTNYSFNANPLPGIASAVFALNLSSNLFTVTPAPFSIRDFSVSGTNLALSGLGGGPNGPCLVFASTNLALPLAQWTPIATNVFDTNGRFSALIALANSLAPGGDRQFFALGFPVGANSVATPIFSPPAHSYFAETPVTITSATSAAIIRYTTDGSTPTESNGEIYTGPVTMHGPINTNATGTITNASGVTMLKAVAFKGGMPDSEVWTGIYTILDTNAFPPATVPSPLCGIAHMAYNVSSSNWDSTLGLWTNYYGLGAVLASNNFALIKINDQQYVELYRVPLLVSNQWQLANYGYEVTDAEAYRQLLETNGLSVPPGVTTNALGNLSFFTVDPDGHTNEWVQYLPGSVTGLSQGRCMPGTQVVGFANCFGILTIYGSQNNVTGPPITYYHDQCGFLGQVTDHTFDIPSGGKAYIELLTAGSGGATQDTAGKHGKLQFMNFRGLTIFQTINILTNRDPSITYLLAPENRHYAFDVDTPDLSRIRINDF